MHQSGRRCFQNLSNSGSEVNINEVIDLDEEIHELMAQADGTQNAYKVFEGFSRFQIWAFAPCSADCVGQQTNALQNFRKRFRASTQTSLPRVGTQSGRNPPSESQFSAALPRRSQPSHYVVHLIAKSPYCRFLREKRSPVDISLPEMSFVCIWRFVDRFMFATLT